MTRLAIACLALAAASIAHGQPKPLERIKLPPGFEITVFADNVPNARSMALGEKGTLFVGSMSAGKVYAIQHDGRKATQVTTIASALNMPNGVAVKDGALYVAEVDRIWRYDAIESSLPTPGKPTLVYGKYPSEKHHGWKFIRFGPDGWLYVPVGSPCNICDREAPFASITRLKPDGSAMEVFARGIRNSVGFDWDPETKDLWFTDNGRDMLGDDLPPDELNHAPRAGMHFGYPYCHGGDLPDPEFGGKRSCAEFTPPAQKLGAHVAALGMRFYNGSMFPDEYRNRIFIAQHGSWNRSKKSGYRVMTAKVEGGKVTDYRVFAEGFLDVPTDTAWGRPVDVQVMPDGALLVSDDQSGAIYRIAYRARSVAGATGTVIVTREMRAWAPLCHFAQTAPAARRTLQSRIANRKKQMNTARIDRMLRELHCDPSHQFFSAFFGIIGLGSASATPRAEACEDDIPASLLDNAPAR